MHAAVLMWGCSRNQLVFACRCADVVVLLLQKLIRMNMPVKEDGSVHFTTTLFALIRESLTIKMGKADEMDTKDEELRAIVSKLWAVPAKKLLHLLVPPNEGTT